jgi:hypothetical protein
MKRSRNWTIGVITGVFILVLIVAVLPVSPVIDAHFKSGDVAKISPESSLKALRAGVTAKITYYRGGRPLATVTLWQDFFHQPLIIVPAADDRAILCLYDSDTSLDLVKIDPANPFTAFSPNSALSSIVCASPWSVSLGTTNDWDHFMSCLRKMPAKDLRQCSVPTLAFGPFRKYASRDALLDRLEMNTIRTE